ncbi:hypothetical protein JGS22_013980 [Streptomyces sp. P38-E01]|uniref:ATP-grasp domain-containing protein n=1 Tax=Streptomyces tardus TaxID=2780544 RepID=A0A949JGW6_9ACTN|nr:hypothetical protein [Streptomyces tardus]MBU7598693.1 hypothetical protein [Streptomyces tardus]
MNPPLTPLAVLLNPRVQTVRVAREVGAHTLMVGPDLTAPGMNRAAAEADQVLEADWRDHRRLAANLSHLTGVSRVSIFGFEDGTALAAARANWCLRLAGSSPRSVAVLSDPLALREQINSITSTPVRHALCSAAELPRAACQVGFPCSVRPRQSAARTGPSAAEPAVVHGVIEAERLADRLPAGELVVEEYLEGPRVVVEAYSHLGSHTIHDVTPVPGTDGAPGPEGAPGIGRDRRTSGSRGSADRDRLLDPEGPELNRLVSDTLDAADYWAGPSRITAALTARGPRPVAARACPAPDSGLPAVAIAALLELAGPAHRAQAS